MTGENRLVPIFNNEGDCDKNFTKRYQDVLIQSTYAKDLKF